MKKLSTVLLMLLLSACANQVQITDSQQTNTTVAQELNRPMYLRGDFTLWDAESHYMLQESKKGVYSVKAKFMTPGKVYEFKLADDAWSKGFNCGYKVQGTLRLNQPQLADCDTVYNYFNFMPKKKGWYKITLDYSDNRSPKVLVTKN
ncbi:hypothetical protein J8L98_20545 [Pseudoalteromonas sp. MMG013]|uniref:hypothetical protein n=1 Tax=Pseudoalteromonas sp. MMG013 TaxID=2822687 RepID=UPI001B35DF18|nr:hypothetical protein [Pseudoalteromonas sp. MMG013]MBQ4864082.1 hypothetical protein [Pseudoalteromonas sp. MMG013]